MNEHKKLDFVSNEIEKAEYNAKPADNEREEETVFHCIKTRRDERVVAFNLLYAADRANYTIPLDQVIKNFEKGFGIVIPAKGYAVILVKETIKARKELDQKLLPLLKNWKLDRLGCVTKLILHIALWELQQPSSIPSIVINEAIELAKNFAEKDAYKFVNGMLDEYRKKSQNKS